jgi:predicted nucleotide-binding protein (sugar kinase/HSP70/actin superfamily)
MDAAANVRSKEVGSALVEVIRAKILARKSAEMDITCIAILMTATMGM